MKREDLTQEKLKSIVSYDKESGLFTRLNNISCYKAGEIVGSQHNEGYLVFCIDYLSYKLHRLAWLYVYGEHPAGIIDHIDGNKLNNKIDNLRVVSDLINSQNVRHPRSSNKSGYLGVSWHKKDKRWHAHIRVNKKTVFLGGYHSPDVAYVTYVEAKRKMHEGCTI
jgi:hypothetical protein